jgi:hypothetical protein
MGQWRRLQIGLRNSRFGDLRLGDSAVLAVLGCRRGALSVLGFRWEATVDFCHAPVGSLHQALIRLLGRGGKCGKLKDYCIPYRQVPPLPWTVDFSERLFVFG